MLFKKYKSLVINVENPLEGIYTIELTPLQGKYRYEPGQFLHLALDEKYDGVGQWPNSRCFSMQNKPDGEIIQITYAVKGEFTREMEKSLSIGATVWLKLPYGNFLTQHHDKTQTVFIAGGTGITPFQSLFTHRSFIDYKNPKIYLGFKTQGHNIYEQYLLELLESPQAEIEIFYEDTDGVINIDYIFHKNGKSSTYFISGPPNMLKVFRQKLMGYGVPREQVLTDDWE